MPSPVYNNFKNLITFSRASNATLVDATGRITYAPANLALQSQTFDNATWTRTATTVSADATTAPDGTTTADKVAEDTLTASHSIQQTASFTAGVAYTMSVYVKKGSGVTAPDIIQSSFNIGAFGTQYANFNISTGVVTASVGGTAAITSVGSGWYRISWTATCTTTTASGLIIPILFCNNNPTATRAPSYAGATTSDVFVWGAQLEVVTYQTTPSTYNPTTTAAYYGPRLDYDPATLALKGLLVEEARTNLALQSQTLDSATWTKNGSSITANATTAPDGTLTADLWVPTTSGNISSTRLLQMITVASATAYTATVYVKAFGRRWVYFSGPDATSNSYNCWFDLQNGVVGTKGANVTSATITNVGNGWYRLSTTSTSTVITNYMFVSSTDADNSTTVTANSVDGLYVWGAQLEAGAFATSYIPTVAASVARSADLASMTGSQFAPWFNQNTPSSGTFVVVGSVLANTTTNQVSLRTDGSTGISVRTVDGGGAGSRFLNSDTTLDISIGTYPAANTTIKLAVTFGSNDAAFSKNGSAPSTDTSYTAIGGVTFLNVGRFSDSAWFINGHIQSVTYYPRRLSNSQLQSLTS